MLKKIVIFSLMLLYIYVLTFDIFLNQYLKFPLIFVAILLAFFFRDPRVKSFKFIWELLFLFLANLFYYAIAQGLLKPFFVNFLVFTCCSVFFNFFVGYNIKRLQISVILFFSFLSLSVIVMGVNHFETFFSGMLREKMLGSPVVQSPSGISTTIFIFGYQVVAFSTLMFLYVLFKKKHLFWIFLALMIALTAIFYGMQRSALIVFAISAGLAIIWYYRLKSIPMLVGVGVCCLIFFTVTSRYNSDEQYNILNKAVQSAEIGENRGGLITENLEIYSDHPFGLLFYNKKWSEVSRYNPTYQGGLTSHNAYLMFLTYLGPLVALFILIVVYYRLFLSFKNALVNIQDRNYALLTSLCFAFLAISMNSLFHNAWLINANGPTVFLFFCILQLNKIHVNDSSHDHSKEKYSTIPQWKRHLVRTTAQQS